MMRIFHCDQCAQILYFENTHCLACRSDLGFLPDIMHISKIQQVSPKKWTASAEAVKGRSYKKCAHYEYEGVCNWMIPAESSARFCLACDLNLTIPDLSHADNRLYWKRLETAKRRLIYSLLKLNLPIAGRKINAQKGLAFQFLEDERISYKETKKIMTGHTNGLITINIAEADEIQRAQMQVKMKEQYRTVLGHFRHEIGHYYWSVLVENSAELDSFRLLFGDERRDYSQALKKYYRLGPELDWRERCVSAYAACHSWEDWAETWAHYLHLVDTLETAQAWGLSVNPQKRQALSRDLEAPRNIFKENQWLSFEAMYQSWTELACAINSMNRSMGQNDFYPFALAPKAIEKLRFVDTVIKRSGALLSEELPKA